MRTPIAVTLIIMGALLIMTPALADLFYQNNVAAIMAKSGATSVVLDGKMSEFYRFGCWLTGSVMVGVAVISSLVRERSSREEVRFSSQGA